MSLTIPQIKNAQPKNKPYKVSDGQGLYLLVQPNGAKYWRLKYRFAGKEKILALGIYPSVSLKEARGARDQAKEQLRQIIDPAATKKATKRAEKAKGNNSFEAVAKEWWKKQQGRWSTQHANKVWHSLEKDVFPYLGHRPIAEIEPPEILDVIRKVEKRGALDVAGRVLQRISSVFRYAVQTYRTKYDPTISLAGALQTRKTTHRQALSRKELPAFLKALTNYDGHIITQLALKLLVITFCRSNEIRFAKWQEFELEAKLWRIPAQRMKMGTEHLVPLSNQAIAILDQLRPISGQGEHLFPSERGDHQPISENTMLYAMYRMGYKSKATPHGFRTSASSILNEEGFNPDAIERQLSHMERNQVRGAYTQHAQYLPERTKMMAWWANYLDQLEHDSNVIAGAFGAGNH